MVELYKIKTENGNKVLYLYLNYNYEFGKDINDEVLTKVKREIDLFNIAKIVLIIGGITFSTILIKDNYNSTYLPHNNISDNLAIDDYEKVVKTQTLEPKENIEIDNVENKKIIKNNEIKDIKISIDKKEREKKTNIKSNNNSSELVYVKVRKTNGSIEKIELEEYIIGVVAAEMPASFPIEALKAQAVVARTYALKRISKGEILTDTSSTQAYKTIDEMKEVWGNSFNTYYNKIVSAVNDTKGETLVYKGEYIDAVYHSTSNGLTENAINVWGNDIPYLRSVASSWDKNVSTFTKTSTLDFLNVLYLLGIEPNDNINIEIISKNDSGRINEIKIGENIYSGVYIRNQLGLRSADFDLEISNGSLIITTRGYGHGVGMSQYGASGMAKEGYTYKQILNYYYTGVSFKT